MVHLWGDPSFLALVFGAIRANATELSSYITPKPDCCHSGKRTSTASAVTKDDFWDPDEEEAVLPPAKKTRRAKKSPPKRPEDLHHFFVCGPKKRFTRVVPKHQTPEAT